MEHAISFPALGLDFNINRVAVNLFGKDIYWYGIIICLGFVLAALYINRRTKEFGVTSDNLMDCLIICVPVGIICARIYYVAFEWAPPRGLPTRRKSLEGEGRVWEGRGPLSGERGLSPSKPSPLPQRLLPRAMTKGEAHHFVSEASVSRFRTTKRRGNPVFFHCR